MENTYGVLFVCLGNICRSPLGEGIFKHLVTAQRLSHKYRIDSCGTGGWHVGSKPHNDSIRIARERGIDISGQRARRVSAEDFKRFNLFVAMDRSNRSDLLALPGASAASIVCLREYDSVSGDLDVPDPYYGGWDGFIEVYDIVSRCCEGLLASLEA